MWKRCCASGKRGYSSKSAARKASAFMKEKLRVYFCEHCKLWHMAKANGLPAPDQVLTTRFRPKRPRLKRDVKSIYANKPRVDPEELKAAVEKKETA